MATPTSPSTVSGSTYKVQQPPTYPGTYQQQPLLGSSSAPPPAIIVETSRRDHAGRRACRRFAKAFVFAILIYALASLLFGSMVDVGRHIIPGSWESSKPSWPTHSAWHVSDDCPQNWQDSDFSIQSSEMPDATGKLVDWSAPYSASTSFELSPALGSYLIVGSRAYGNIDFSTSNSNSDKIAVKVTAHYYNQQALDRARICKLKKGNGGEGVGLYMPLYRGPWHQNNQIHFSVSVVFPSQKSPTKPLYINSFETYLSMFTHALQDLDESVNFGRLTLRTSNAKVTAEGVSARSINIRSSNAQIIGSFRTNNTLILNTSNGKIDVDTLSVYNSKNVLDKVTVELRTSNAPIIARSSLTTTTSPSEGGSFTLTLRTSNSPLTLTIPTQPPLSLLDLTTRTSNSRSDVVLHPAYEGTFQLSTSSHMGVPKYDFANGAEDPSGEGRKRVTSTSEERKGSVVGRTSWGTWDDGKGKGKHYGNVDVSTSNGLVTLKI